MRLHSPDDLRELVERYLDELVFASELGALADVVRYPLESGGKRIRPVLCLAVGEAAGAEPERCLPAAAAVELVHTFSLVHDDLPALDDDNERRGRPSVHVAYGEAAALLAGGAAGSLDFQVALLPVHLHLHRARLRLALFFEVHARDSFEVGDGGVRLRAVERNAGVGEAVHRIANGPGAVGLKDVDALRALPNVEAVVYPEGEHGFVHDPSRPTHRAEDAADAWARVIEFLTS